MQPESMKKLSATTLLAATGLGRRASRVVVESRFDQASALGRRLIQALLVLFSLVAVAQAVPAPAGTNLDNTATSDYVYGANRGGANSNPVRAVVQNWSMAVLTSSSATTRTSAGRFALAYRLTNTGPTSAPFTVRVDNAGGAWTPANLQVVVDANGNGVADAGEVVVNATTPIVLASGESANLLVIGSAPSGTAANTNALLNLVARSVDGTATLSATGTVTVAGDASVTLTDRATNTSPLPGSTVGFDVVGTATDTTVEGVPIFVDGSPLTRVGVRNAVPANTRYVSAAPLGAEAVYYHRRGDASHRFWSTPGDPANIDSVLFTLPTLAAGQAIGGRLNVVVAANASGSTTQIGRMRYTDQGAVKILQADPVTIKFPDLRSTIEIYGTSGYVRPIKAFSAGANLFLQLNAASCNADPDEAEVRQVRMNAPSTGDSEVVTVYETGPNTGIFRSVDPVKTIEAKGAALNDSSGTLAVTKNETVTATPVGCGSDALVASTLVDPAGVLFDSRTNALIAGATVTLIDVTGGGNGGKPGQPAVVFAEDGVTAYPSTLTTGADGAFVFPLVAPSTYRLQITAPTGYTFPSKVGVTELPAGHIIDPSGSYGNTFRVIDELVLLDVPLDSIPVDGLFVEKRASKSIADIGDFVDYTVTVKNSATVGMANVVVHDQLPRGFVYVPGTTRVAGQKVADPTSAAVLDFAVGALTPGQQIVMTYRLRVGPGARGGDGVNRAYATAGASRSNTASVQVRLSDGGVFSDRGYLIGKVYADCNRNGVQDEGEPGIPDVRIVLEDGTFAITDEFGKYSLYGLLPRTHVAKVDASTLFEGAELEVLDQRNAGDGNSRFIDLKNGELHRGDFAVAGCTPATRAAIESRKKNVSRVSELISSVKALLSTTPVVRTDSKSLPATGTFDGKGIVGAANTTSAPVAATQAAIPTAAPAAGTLSGVNAQAPVAPVAPAAAAPADLASRLAEADPRLAFLDLADGAVMPGTQARIRVKGPAGAKLILVVNGKPVDERQVGERSVLADRNVAAVEYVGVDLVPGANKLELLVQDPFGNARDRLAITVKAPGRLARIVIETAEQAKADGRSVLPVTIRLVDADGVPVTGRMPIQLDASAGAWIGRDVSVRDPSFQVFVEGGRYDAELMAPGEPGRTTLRAAAGSVKAETVVTFVPDLRPMLAVGVIEGAINLNKLGSNGIVPAQSGDVFEREIRNVSRDFHDNKASAAARGALYLKGKVLGETLLTLAYDSDKPQQERLFRDIQPDQFYPVYGDSSTKGFDAQSTGRLYVRVDNGLSYVLYGDFTTQTNDPARALTQYNRALNGAKSRVELGPVRVESFAAYTDTQQVVDEIRGMGTSGPYVLSRANGVTNSEQVHVITRDRNQPAVIIKDVVLTRFTDYEIEPFTGRLLFKAPIPSVDADLNPVWLRITYEVATGGQKFWVGGVDAKVQVAEGADVGGVYIRDTDPSNRATLKGVNGSLKVGDKGILVGELAESESDLYGTGRGRRLEYKQESENLSARLYAGKTDVDFRNPNALLSQGRSEYGGKIGLKVSERDRLTIEGIRSQDPTTGGARTGVLARVERSLDNGMKVELGMRHAFETVAAAQPTSLGLTPDRFTSVRTKLTVPVPYVRDLNVFGEYERAIGGGNRQIAAIGGNYALANGGKLYARHEFISSLAGAYDLNSTQRLHSTVVGVDSDYMQDGHLFNEYRAGGTIDGRSAEAAIGLRNLWRIAEGLNVTTTAENIKPVGGASDNRSNALTGGVDYTGSPDWKGSARAEWRNGATQDSWLATIGAAYRLSEETTLLTKGIYSTLENSGGASVTGGLRRIARAQLGAAYRPTDTNVWNALARVEFKREQDNTIADAAIDESAIIGSAHVNVSPTPDLSFAGRYGIKRATARAGGIVSSATTQLIGGRLIKDFAEKWDIGLNTYMLTSGGLKNRSYALGLEGGYRVATNLWVSVGYNVSGFKDKDLASEEYTQRGVYLRMRYKFDENVFGGTKSAKANG